MDIREVVTTQSAEGRSVLVSDQAIAPITAALLGEGGFYRLWGSDAPATLPQNGSSPAPTGWFPPPGGFRFAAVVFGPERPLPPDLDMDDVIGEVAVKVPGLAEVLDPDHPGMHRTDTIDFGYVASGEVWLELDDATETRLSAGDCFIQCGTRHAWHNRSSQPCLMIVTTIGAAR